VNCKYKQDIPDVQLDEVRTFSLFIGPTPTEGVFKGNFYFGDVEGTMVLGRDDGLIDMLSKRDDGGIDSGSDDEEYGDGDLEIESDDDDSSALAGSKRKGKDVERGKPAKKPMTTKRALGHSGGSESLRFFVRLKDRTPSIGHITCGPHKGVIEFDGGSGSGSGGNKVKGKRKGEGDKSGGNPFSSLTGKVDLEGIGIDVPFTARKVSDLPGRLSDMRWEEFTEQAYESICPRRCW